MYTIENSHKKIGMTALVLDKINFRTRNINKIIKKI